MTSEHYSRAFFEQHQRGAKKSAEVIVPLVLRLLSVRSVVDIGCGDGSWLAVFRALGVSDLLGIDGEYVAADFLQIPRDQFRAADLSKPFDAGRRFDLAVSLEVAEHLPAECAQSFVRSLVDAAPAVLFSAAIPHQGGANHLNEQWPEWWAALFKEHGYLAIDAIRGRIWHDRAVEFWYAQNILLFADPAALKCNPSLEAEFERTDAGRLSLVHPKHYVDLHNRFLEASARPTASGVIPALRLLGICLRNSARKRILGRM